MAIGYSKEFLIDAYLSRFINSGVISPEAIEVLENLANKHYDKVGKDKFRTSASLDAEAIRVYKSTQ